MATGIKYNKKQELLDSIKDIVYKNNKNAVTADNIQKAIKNVVESLMENIVEDNENYTLHRNIVDTEFIVRLVIKKSVVLNNLVLLPANLAVLATFNDLYYISYHPTNTSSPVKYNFSLDFNKLLSDNSFALAGDSYLNQLHLLDNVGNDSNSFSYTYFNGYFNFQTAIIRETGVKVSGEFIEGTGGSFYSGGVLEFVFKGNLIGKL